MTQTEKRRIILICLVLMILAFFILARYYMQVTRLLNSDKSVSSESVIGEEITVGFHCTTETSQLSKTQNGDIAATSRTFTHRVYTSEGNYLTTLTVTITGSVSPSESIVSHLSSSLAEAQWDGLTLSELVSGNTATVILFQDQLSICHFQYRISQEGLIDLL